MAKNNKKDSKSNPAKAPLSNKGGPKPNGGKNKKDSPVNTEATSPDTIPKMFPEEVSVGTEESTPVPPVEISEEPAGSMTIEMDATDASETITETEGSNTTISAEENATVETETPVELHKAEVLGAGPNDEVVTDEKELQAISNVMQSAAISNVMQSADEEAPAPIEVQPEPAPIVEEPVPVVDPVIEEPIPVKETVESILNQATLPPEFVPVTATSNHPDEMKLEKFLRMRRGTRPNIVFPGELMSSGINMSRFGMLDGRVGKFRLQRKFVNEGWLITIE